MNTTEAASHSQPAWKKININFLFLPPYNKNLNVLNEARQQTYSTPTIIALSKNTNYYLAIFNQKDKAQQQKSKNNFFFFDKLQRPISCQS